MTQRPVVAFLLLVGCAGAGTAPPGATDGPIPRCDNRVKDGRETDVDCGGTICDACESGSACREDGDCASVRCERGVCAAPLAPCENGVVDGRETDVDCGGGCRGCTLDKVCRQPGDCLSAVCEGGTCGPAPACDDQKRNGDETDVDCGGKTCRGCDDGEECLVSDDCLRGLCRTGKCDNPAELVGRSGNFVFFRARVVGAMTDTNVLAACQSIGMTVGCAGPVGCQYNDGVCTVTNESDCNVPMKELATSLACNAPAGCVPMFGLYQYMGHKWDMDDACGVEPNKHCVPGSTMMDRFALCLR